MVKRFALSLFLMLLTASSGWAATKYVSATGTASWANASAIETPCSLATANANVAAGDIVYLRAGTYTGQIAPANSGTSASRILIEGYSTETVTITYTSGHQANLNAKSYVTLSKLNFQNATGGMWVDARGSTGVWVLSCTFSDARNWAGISFHNSSYAVVRGNTLTAGTCPERTADACPADLIYARNSSYGLYEQNSFGKAGHYGLDAGGDSNRNIIRNNIFANIWHANVSPGWSGNSLSYSTKRSMVDSNIIKDAGSDCYNNPLINDRCPELAEHNHPSIQVGRYSSYNIIRRNIFYNNGSFNMESSGGACEYNKIFNNTFDEEVYALYSAPGVGAPSQNYNTYKNNHIGRSTRGLSWAPATSAFTQYWRYNNWYGNTTNSYKGVSGSDASFVDGASGGIDASFSTEFVGNLNVAPGFTNQSGRDYTLTSASALKDAGEWLTTITSPTGSGTSFIVVDSGYFIDGWGIVTGDQIKLQNGQSTTITAINYTTHTITVSPSVSWNTGTGVSLASLAYGSAPPIGAYDYDPGAGTVPATPASPTAGTPTVSSIPFSWTASMGATGYRVYLEGALYAATTATSLTVWGLTPDTEYDLQVSAYNADGESALTTAVQATTAAFSSGDIKSETFTAQGAWTFGAGGAGITQEITGGNLHLLDQSDAIASASASLDVGDAPFEYTLFLDDLALTALPDTFQSGARYLGVRVSDGEKRFSIFFMADGVYVGATGTPTAIPGVAAVSSTNDYTIKVRRGSPLPCTIDLYQGDTLLASGVNCGTSSTSSDGLVEFIAAGTAADTAEFSISGFTLSSGLEPPVPSAPSQGVVAFRVGPNYTSYETGDGTVSISNGVATFSVAQTSTRMGPGSRIQYDTSSYAHILGKLDTDGYQWSVVTIAGAWPANVSDKTVNGVTSQFTTLDTAIDGTNGIFGSSWLNTIDLVTAKLKAKIYCEPFTDTTDASNRYTDYSFSGDYNVEIYGDPEYILRIQNAVPFFNTWPWVVIDGLNIELYGTNASGQAAIFLDGPDSVVNDKTIKNCKITGFSTNSYTGHYGIFVAGTSGAAGSRVFIINNTIENFGGNSVNASGVTSNDADVSIIAYNNTIRGCRNGFYNIAGSWRASNNIVDGSLVDGWNGTFAAGDYNCTSSSDAQAPGANSFVFNVTFASGSSELSSSDQTAAEGGTDLSSDTYYALSTDLLGRTRSAPWSVGAYEYQYSFDIIRTLSVSSGPAYVWGPQNVVLETVFSNTPDSCVITEGETELDTSVSEQVVLSLTAGSHTLRRTCNKSGYTEDYAEVTVRVFESTTEGFVSLGSGGDWATDDEIDYLGTGWTISLIGNVDLDLSTAEITSISLSGTGYGTITGGGQTVTQWPTWGGPIVIGGSWGSLPALINKKGEWPE